MRSNLAEKLLIKVLDWSSEEVTEERPLIQAMANFKYDEYQQFSPGIRFTESLAQWLVQFEISERKIAYEFIKNNLVFISSQQVTHLVEICFSEKINPLLMKKVSSQMNIPSYHVKKIYNSNEYKEAKRRTLFLGVSDGAKIDQLRRSSRISNEQVFSSYYISSEKKDDMLNKLSKEGYENKFNSVFLIDDFTGSGLSYFRTENGESTGKICKFLKLIFNIDKLPEDSLVLPNLIDSNNFDFHIVFYIARREAIDYLRKEISDWKKKTKLQFDFTVDAVQIIENSVKDKIIENEEVIKLSKKYIDDSIIDSHYDKGKHKEFYLGFDECALPLVLYHNTPNNALPLLWWFPDKDQGFRGLFPRITRHKE